MKPGWLLACAFPAFAHMVSMSTGDLHVDGSRAQYELRMPSYEVAHVKDPERTLLEHIRFRGAGADGTRVQQNCSEQQGTYVCNATYQFPAPVDVIEAECTFARITVPNHVHLLRAYRGGKSDQAVFDLSFTTAEIRFRPPTAFETAVREGSAGFMRAAGGLAPLLFLAGLALAARSRRELLVSTAAFLTAEVIACLLAPRLASQLSPRFIEAAAALTVAYLAFEIILLPNSGQRWLIIGVLGLFHGTYFSIFLTGSGFHLAPFLGGVLMAELLLIAVFAFALGWLARLPRAVPVAASMMLTIGVIWFVLRLRS